MVRIFTGFRRPFGTITKVMVPNERRHYAFHLFKYTRCFACFAIHFFLAFLLIEAQFAGLARCPWLAKVWYDGSKRVNQVPFFSVTSWASSGSGDALSVRMASWGWRGAGGGNSVVARLGACGAGNWGGKYRRVRKASYAMGGGAHRGKARKRPDSRLRCFTQSKPRSARNQRRASRGS